MYKMAVIGNPIAHSKSPLIWTEFAKQCGIELEYTKICAAIDGFEQTVRNFFKGGGLALSVTAPFKARAYQFANKHSPQTLGAATANHLIRRDELIYADNTDGVGLVADIKHLGQSLNAKKILLIGSGSVIHSVLSSLAVEQPQRMDLLMRNPDKLDEFQNQSSRVAEFDSEIAYDVVINTTPNTPENMLFGQIQHLGAGALAYDMIYTAESTLFMQRMLEINSQCLTANGRGMLIQQARAAFANMFGVTPEVDAVYKLLLAE